MRVAIAFVAGLIVAGAGLTFGDVAKLADTGVDSARTVVSNTVNK